MAELFITRFEGVRRLAVLAVVLSLFVACGEGPPGGPSPPTALAVSSVTPNTATIGTTIFIVGSGFRTGVTVAFGGVKADVLGIDTYYVSARTPDLAPGRVDIVVTNTSGESATLAGAFTLVLQAPFAVADYFPKRGYGDMLFGIAGTGLIEGTTVKFGGIPPKVEFAGGLQGIVNGLLPAHDPGPVDITVRHPDGRTVTIPNGLTYVPPPVLTASPATVTVGGSVTVSWVAEVISILDYIALYQEGGERQLLGFLVPGNSGSRTFTLPSSVSPGRYEFRYLPTDGQWDAVATVSNVVTVK